MISSIIRTSFLILARDRGALVLTFVLPVAFFSIFAGVFGSQKNVATAKIRIAIVDEDHSDSSRRLVQALQQEAGLTVQLGPTASSRVSTKAFNENQKPGTPVDPPQVPLYDLAGAEAAVREGKVPVALIIRKGYGEAPIAFGNQESVPKLSLLNDISDPIAPQVVNGLLQKTVVVAMPDVMATQGSKHFEQMSGGLTPQQKKNIDQQLRFLRTETERQQSAPANNAAVNSAGLVPVEMRDVLGEKKANPIIAFYAAGIGVMFLLFSASRSGGALLDEADTGALDRVLSTRVTMTTLMLGKLYYLAILGFLELTVMFLWAMLVFKLDFLPHLPGFIVMTTVTTLCASAFGLLLASVARTRAQLAAISTLVILMMSAIGGSMFPRFLMPENVQRFGLITFNAWALDGYIKVFWRGAAIVDLWPQVSVLASAALVFFLIARRLAHKWEYS
ncbi:MAG TPA: ABC transporter permease [Terriglobales bacterium]|nr:ABC transporter permease [Terriglobales bacterium]